MKKDHPKHQNKDYRLSLERYLPNVNTSTYRSPLTTLRKYQF